MSMHPTHTQPDEDDAFEELADDMAAPEAAPDMQPQPQQPADAAAAAQIADAFRAQLAKIEAERDDFKDRWMRSEAEMVNLRARTKREVEDARQYAMQKFARDVAEAADNLRRGLSSLPAPAEAEHPIVGKLREGFEGVERSFLGLLERNGIAKQDPTFQPFDPNQHQAMAEQPSDEHPPGTVLQAWTPVWTLNGRLLRPAMVVVSKAPDAGKTE